MKLTDVVYRINGNVDRFTTDLEYYIGGEHFDSEELVISKHGKIKENLGKLGFKFHFAFQDRDVIFMARNPHLRKAGMVRFSGLCSDASYILRSKDEKVISQEFLAVLLQSDRFWDYCESHKVGSVNFANNWSTIANYEFELPSQKFQKEIADKVWAVYEVKQSYLKMIAATEEMVKAQFVEMFGDGNYPTKRWEDCLTITNGKRFDGVYQEYGTYPICGSAGIMGYGEQMLCSKGTIILGRKGNINSPIYMESDYWIVDTAFSLDVNKQKLQPKYFYFWCKQLDFTRYNKQGVLPSLTKNDLLKIEMPIPPMRLQRQFVTIMEQAEVSISELRKSVDAIDKVIKSLINENL
ncbi:MAG: restriction endonuclease subunit S [Bacteroidales bacterium]|nr:restriction endonuclease subunit S [Bacteroidales bacterium]